MTIIEITTHTRTRTKTNQDRTTTQTQQTGDTLVENAGGHRGVVKPNSCRVTSDISLKTDREVGENIRHEGTERENSRHNT